MGRTGGGGSNDGREDGIWEVRRTLPRRRARSDAPYQRRAVRLRRRMNDPRSASAATAVQTEFGGDGAPGGRALPTAQGSTATAEW